MKDAFVKIITRASTTLPADVREAISNAAANPDELPRARAVLSTILDNAEIAEKRCTPICQDTGTLTFWVDLPSGVDKDAVAVAVREAVRECTRNGILRQNTIMPVSGSSVADNIAEGAPSIHFATSDTDAIKVALLMKGGGCENMSTQYSLPDQTLSAGRDLQGVRACILHSVWRAQGMGCAPGILGVCIGGDRAQGFAVAKRQLLRELGDKSPVKKLAALERTVLREANSLEIGPMGLGGKTTLLGLKIAESSRLPASFFVTIAYSCWACRRIVASIDPVNGEVIQ